MQHFRKGCLVLAALGALAPAATLELAEAKSADRLGTLPMLTFAEAVVSPVAVLESGGARLAGLVLNLPSLEGESWRAVADLPQDLPKVIERAEIPRPTATAAVVSFGNWDFPMPTVIAFALGIVLLAAGAVCGGALLKLTMADARKQKRMRRRYAP